MSKKLKGKNRNKNRKKMRLNNFHNKESYKKKLLNKILKWDDPVLKSKCSIVAKDENIENILKDMGRILYYSNGAGIAANQIGVIKRIILVLIDKKKPTFLVNPEIVSKSEDELIDSRESCLSYPGIISVIKRYKKVEIKYEDENRELYQKTFENFNSIVIQHEISHLSGECDLYRIWKERIEENNKKSSLSAAKIENNENIKNIEEIKNGST